MKLLAGIGILIAVLLIAYGVCYLLILGIFWAFGPVIFGYTFGPKIVIECMILSAILSTVFKRR